MHGDCPQKVYVWHTWTSTSSVRVVCIRFPLQGVYRFESPRLSDMSNRLFVVVNTYLINGIMFINELMTLLYFNAYMATLVLLSLGLLCLKFD
jgi:hypothetical protein